MRKSCIQNDIFSLGALHFGLGQSMAGGVTPFKTPSPPLAIPILTLSPAPTKQADQGVTTILLSAIPFSIMRFMGKCFLLHFAGGATPFKAPPPLAIPSLRLPMHLL